MTIQTPVRKLRLFIKHEIGQYVHYKSDEDTGILLNASTHAILENEQGLVLGAGHAYCYAGDQFRKKVGVRIAVTRAIAGSLEPNAPPSGNESGTRNEEVCGRVLYTAPTATMN